MTTARRTPHAHDLSILAPRLHLHISIHPPASTHHPRPPSSTMPPRTGHGQHAPGHHASTVYTRHPPHPHPPTLWPLPACSSSASLPQPLPCLAARSRDALSCSAREGGRDAHSLPLSLSFDPNLIPTHTSFRPRVSWLSSPHAPLPLPAHSSIRSASVAT